METRKLDILVGLNVLDSVVDALLGEAVGIVAEDAAEKRRAETVEAAERERQVDEP